MPVTLRTWEPDDEPFLWDMLHQAIHVGDGQAPPPRSVLDDPPIRHYLAGFGSRFGDDAVIACVDGVPIGAAFCRLFGADEPAYGFVSEDVPELGMAVIRPHRGSGIGRAMLSHLVARHPAMSLSVDTGNVAARSLYESSGFTVVRAEGSSLTMFRRG